MTNRQKNLDFYFRKDTNNNEIQTPAPETLLEQPVSTNNTEAPTVSANASCAEVVGSSDSSPFAIWTEEMWKRKKEAYPWIDSKDGKLGCKVCSSVSDLSVFRAQGSRMGDEWRSYSVTYSGTEKSTMLTSLRKKILIFNQVAMLLLNAFRLLQNERQSIKFVIE